MPSLLEPHTGGVEFFRFLDLKSLDAAGYFIVFDRIMPLLRDPEFNTVTPAFYINYITNPDDNQNSLRITYFTTNPPRTLEILNTYVQNHKSPIVLFESVWTSQPTTESELGVPDAEELRFRNFLGTNTKIAMDVIENYDLEEFRDLVYQYRHTDLANKVSPKKVFGEIFTLHSPYFRELEDKGLGEQYWKDLTHLFNGRDFGLHFLVNMMVIPEAPYSRDFFREDWIDYTLIG